MFDIDASEVRELAADIAASTGRVVAAAAQVVRKTAADVQHDAQNAAPVDTGYLRSSISTTVTGDGRNGQMTAEVGPTAGYGIYQELGTSRMAPQPFLFPALDRNTPGFYEAIEQLGGGIL